MTIRFLTPDEVVNLINPALALRNMAQLNVNCCQVVGAFDDSGALVMSFTGQLFPILGPLLRHDNLKRDDGETAREVIQFMTDFLIKKDTRGVLTIADSPVTERFASRYGMTRVESPVFLWVPGREQVVQ